MKRSVEQKIKALEQQIHLCSIISIVALVITVLLLAVEFVAAQFGGNADWVRNVIKACIYILYVMPFVVVIPLFFRVNLKGKLYQMKKQEKNET